MRVVFTGRGPPYHLRYRLKKIANYRTVDLNSLQGGGRGLVLVKGAQFVPVSEMPPDCNI